MEFEKVKSILENLDDNELKRIWNEYCRNNYYDDQEIFEMCEIDDLFCDMKVSDFLDKLGDFDHRDNYFVYGVYGLESFNDVSDKVYFYDLANYIVANNETFDNDELEELIEEDEEEDEEDEEE